MPTLWSGSEFFLGAPDGAPELYFLVGPSLAVLTEKLQRLCGTTPLPPLWALGHHQSRWGYASSADLEALDRSFREHDCPCDGLWFDIDYMRGFRVFTFDPQGFAQPKAEILELRRRGRHIVPILDPGVKVDPDFEVDRDGLERGIFCLNSNGDPYVGFVWPGATHFPDFSLPEARHWWAAHVAEFAETGVSGAWIDMNDPSTGPSEQSEMYFGQGRHAHECFHNQYALGMAKSTREGFLAHDPDRRPFLLSRSAFIGSSRYTAVWTGDNFSNEHNLALTIPMSLNLALSGLPFNGPDVPGFGGDATEALAITWYKAGFLFPFFRNHSGKGTRAQEPWAFGAEVLEVLRHYIRLRYTLLPYLYNLFVDQEERGSAIMRPLFYDFEDRASLALDHIDDQFMLGPCLMHAPIIRLGAEERDLILPDTRWFGLFDGVWHEGGRTVLVSTDRQSTPLFVREGSLVPMRPEIPIDAATDLSQIDFHCFLALDFAGQARAQYRFDDGETFAYRQGKRSSFEVHVNRDGRMLCIKIAQAAMNYRPARIRFILYAPFTEVRINIAGQESAYPLQTHSWKAAGAILTAWSTPEIEVS